MSGAVPKLRFPEFSGPWIHKKVGKIAKLQGGYAFKSEHFQSDGIPVVRISNISTKTGVVDLTTAIHHPEVKIDSKFIVSDGDVLIALSGATTGKACVYRSKKRAYLNQRVGLLRLLNKDHSYDFLRTQIFSKYFGDQLDRVLVAGAQPNIAPKDIEDFSFYFPTLPEQQKIASFLGAVDGKISGLRRKEAALVGFKAGLMQKLFAQKLRFTRDDGSAFPEWSNARAGALFRSISNKNHDGTLPILSMSQEGGAVLRGENGIDIKATTESILSYKIVEPGDFVISLRSFQGGIEYSEILGICSPAYTVMKPNKVIHDLFYKYFFKSRDFITRLSLTVVGIRDGKQISYGAFADLILPYPHPDEQRKIADALSAMDAKIAAVRSQISKMETFKKGLLQQMFV